MISIHALAKRATAGSYLSAVTWEDFNPRPRKEGDTQLGIPNSDTTKFQSTPSQRGRLATAVSPSARVVISIHALAKRATYGRVKTLRQ